MLQNSMSLIMFLDHNNIGKILIEIRTKDVTIITLKKIPLLVIKVNCKVPSRTI